MWTPSNNSKELWWALLSSRVHRYKLCFKMLTLLILKYSKHLNSIEKIYHHLIPKDKSNQGLRIEEHHQMYQWPSKLIAITINLNYHKVGKILNLAINSWNLHQVLTIQMVLIHKLWTYLKIILASLINLLLIIII